MESIPCPPPLARLCCHAAGVIDDVERSLGKLSLIGTDEALRKHMEDMRFERDGLQREIVRLEEDRQAVQREFTARQVPSWATLRDRLTVDESLS